MKNIKECLSRFFLIGVMLMAIQGCGGVPKYDLYSSKDPELNVTMEYPAGWEYREHRGPKDSFASVIFLEKRKDSLRKAFVSLTVTSSQKVNFKPLTLQAMEEDLLARREKFPLATVLQKSSTTILGTEAREIIISNKTLNNLHGVGSKFIPIKERIIIFKNDDKFYLLRYENRTEEFDRFDKAFTHIIGTLRIKENR